MGVAVGAVAVRSSDRRAVLELLGLEETGATISAADLPLGSKHWAVATTPGGWVYIVGDFWRVDDWRLEDASSLGLTVVSSLEEHVMASDVRAYQDGAELWFVAHDPEDDPAHDPRHLEARGDLPEAFASIRERLWAAHDDDDDVDHLIEIPLELAKSTCGLRPDFMLEGDDLNLVFSVLRRNPASVRAARVANALAKRAAETKPVHRSPRVKPTTPFWGRFVSGLRRGWATYRRARAETRAKHARRDDAW